MVVVRSLSDVGSVFVVAAADVIEESVVWDVGDVGMFDVAEGIVVDVYWSIEYKTTILNVKYSTLSCNYTSITIITLITLF